MLLDYLTATFIVFGGICVACLIGRMCLALYLKRGVR